jgi:hypothetical protein
MAQRRSLLTLPLFVVAGGCYADLSVGASRTVGGVSGYGWEIGMAGGLGWDVGKVVRTSAGADVSMARTKADDGKFGTTGLSYHGRADIAISVLHHYSADELTSQAALAASSGGSSSLQGVTGQTRLVLDYGLGTNEKLHFVSPDNPMRFEERSKVHNFYLGIAREYDWQSKMLASFGIGPHVTYMPNDFVGTATAVGLQLHASYWFIPVARRRETGSLMKNYEPSTVAPQKPVDNRTCTTVHDGAFSRTVCK